MNDEKTTEQLLLKAESKSTQTYTINASDVQNPHRIQKHYLLNCIILLTFYVTVVALWVLWYGQSLNVLPNIISLSILDVLTFTWDCCSSDQFSCHYSWIDWLEPRPKSIFTLDNAFPISFISLHSQDSELDMSLNPFCW